ncbi:COX15/CtaA family protein [Sphingomonas sp. PL-96]|uniref:COX15/CtaA family protein n=1 Tax=Sphingomonas sp. PL-96 TaxID=2887201 RepID=UPI001E5A3137|nr:COX15/CtaA family protein [Sphingomonas sp. PL-96]MCC2975737.1 COX15/CtaA family protein [Sphingomonas sp. PL-96]
MARPSIAPAAAVPAPRPRPAAIATWLLAVACLIVLMVVVGGITRLTESGLSITEWKPLTGVIPPLNAEQWQAEFDNYKRIPEYQQLNQGMTLAGFQAIFFWEYLHRLLGRLIGVAFALPLLWFAWKRAIPRGYGWRLVALLTLGGLQGAIGWWMVASGLVERTDVSHFRLATHLLTALFILAGLVWTALDLRDLARDPASRPARLTGAGLAVGLVLLIQLLFGAFTAGLNAGLVTNEWPLMNGRFFPEGVLQHRSLVSALFNDPFLIHFVHRWWAWVTVAALVVLARLAKRGGDRRASIAIHSAFGIQILLGIATVMTGVNIVLAASHQLVGALLVASVAWGAHAVGRRRT